MCKLPKVCHKCPEYLSFAADTLARLSVYTVPSSSPSYSALLPHFVPPRSSLPHTLVMIALDWTRPWSFVQELVTWLEWVEMWVKGDGSRELDITKEENRERRKWISLTVYSSLLTALYAQSKYTGSIIPNLQQSLFLRLQPLTALSYPWVRGRSRTIPLVCPLWLCARKPT